MTDNMKIWNAVKRPPESALKSITGGRLKGMTDIKPQWRYQVMTELFGSCGDGWKLTIERLWTEPGNDGQIMAFAQVNLQYKVPHQDSEGKSFMIWSQPVPGVGGSMLVANESKGAHSSDEGFKMAVTDAASTAMKLIGVGADIYFGQYDGSKYLTPEVEPAPTSKITAEQKRQFQEQVRACLANGDEHGVQELWSEWGTDDKVVLWALFNSQERSAMKSMRAGA
jgi:hypothetical protein